MEQADVLIIGAGLLGCFAARALARYALKTIVLEAREDVCTGISRANTGIVYTGCDTKPDTLKTELCVRANREFDRLCRELEVPFRRCGSLLVGFGPRAQGVLQKKLEQGQQNNVPGLRLLNRAEVLVLEPALRPSLTGGLYAPGTGTVNPWELGIAAFENARANGVSFCFGEAVRQIVRRDGGFLVESEQRSYFSRTIVNCAGLQADAVRELAEKPSVRLFPSGSDYLVLDTDAGNLIHHVIFHEPEEKGKGLTLVPTVDGNLLVGATERPLAASPFATTGEGLAQLFALCRQVAPELPLEQVIRSFGAVRPNPYVVQQSSDGWIAQARSISSFPILEEAGMISMIGIKTPGLTCAAELGRYVAERLTAYLGCRRENARFDPTRRQIPAPIQRPEQASLLQAVPAYGRIICRCRHISEGQVLQAIHRGATTVDGIKRRTGAGMGRCQGGGCELEIVKLLARELNCPPEAVTKDGGHSYILF